MSIEAIVLIVILVVVAAALASHSGGKTSRDAVPADIMDPAAWEIGPIVDGENYSQGVPLHPSAHQDGFSVVIPHPGSETGHVHYVTVPVASLAGKSRVSLRCRFDLADGVRLCPVKTPGAPSLLTLYFQRAGDDWSAVGDFEAYRWYAAFGTVSDIRAGEYTLEARFDQNWSAVLGSTRENNPQGFQAALDDACRIGFVLGGGDGLGHGVFATGPALLVVTDFRVE